MKTVISAYQYKVQNIRGTDALSCHQRGRDPHLKSFFILQRHLNVFAFIFLSLGFPLDLQRLPSFLTNFLSNGAPSNNKW